MRKLIIPIIVVILIMSACANSPSIISEVDNETPQASKPAETPLLEEFSFREHKFWDSLEQVIEREGEPDRDIQHEEEYAYTIIYDDVEIFGYKAELSYTFLYEELYSIRAVTSELKDAFTIERRYEDLKEKLNRLYGDPLKETESHENGYELIAFWTDLEYGLTLFSDEKGFWIIIRRVE